MALDALIFDLDGTLIDTNGAHVESWVRTLARFGYNLGPDRIGPEMGKGGDNLVPDVLGPEADRRDGEAMREMVAEEYVKIVTRERHVRAFDDAAKLLGALRERGIRTALATSSGDQHLDATFDSAGVDFRELVDEVVKKDDVERSKPEPDVVVAALEKLDLSPAQCAMVGDTPHDAEAAKRAGVITLGVLCGGYTSERALRGAGARRVWRDPAHLLAELDTALRVASPGAAHFTRELLERLMRDALAAARDGLAAGEVPVGCVVADGSGTALARAYNAENATGDRTAHAEMEAFRLLAERAPRDETSPRDLVLVTTVEPCVMCLGAAIVSAVDTVVYGLAAPADAGTLRVRNPEDPDSQMPRIVGGVLGDESRALLAEWLGTRRGAPEAAYVEQLLANTTR
jgi:HAD superfamily hydrolase (TIGR01509 family)